MIIQNSTSVFLQTLMYVMNQSVVENEVYTIPVINKGKATNSTKCYGSYGCFQVSSPWISELRPISVFPEDVRKIEPNFLFYSRKNPTNPIFIDLDDFDFVRTLQIDPNLPLYTITHGFLEGGDRPWINRMRDVFLEKENCNIIVVDWQDGSGPPYTQAVANIRLVGAIAAHLLADYAKHTGNKKLKHVHCIGHSLGAHLSAYAGYTLQKDFNLKLGRITGMDPAEPHFAKVKPFIRLDYTAADYVDVIHTDASSFVRGGLGLIEKVGHVDYYPNGGTNQPGCDHSISQYIAAENGSFFQGIKKFLGCNHVRSHEIFLESIGTKCSFMTISCNSFEDLKTGKCFECGKNGQHCVRFGFHGRKDYEKLVENKIIKPQHHIVQYSLTAANEPYCREHYRITVDVSNSTESKAHGGEVGQFIFTMHGTRDGTGQNSGEVALNEGGYHGPGMQYRAVVAAHAVPHLKTVKVEWRFHSNLLNPLTWRIVQSPRIFVSKVKVESLETEQSVTVCPKDNKVLISDFPQLMMASYCP